MGLPSSVRLSREAVDHPAITLGFIQRGRIPRVFQMASSYLMAQFKVKLLLVPAIVFIIGIQMMMLGMGKFNPAQFLYQEQRQQAHQE